mgnify:CR=1 FL=1
MKNIEEITIRPVTEADAEKLLSIYAPYVTDTFITYEYTVPTVEEFRERIRNTLQAYPYFAAVENGRIIGYAYASAFHPRRAYLWSAEATVYLERGVRGRGVGRLLYERLEETLKQQNVQNVNACIAYPNPQSIAFYDICIGFQRQEIQIDLHQLFCFLHHLAFCDPQGCFCNRHRKIVDLDAVKLSNGNLNRVIFALAAQHHLTTVLLV